MRNIFYFIICSCIGSMMLVGSVYANTSPFAPIDSVIQKGLDLPQLPKPTSNHHNLMMEQPIESTKPVKQAPIEKQTTRETVHKQMKQPNKKNHKENAAQPIKPKPQYGISGLNPNEGNETESSDQGFELHF